MNDSKRHIELSIEIPVVKSTEVGSSNENLCYHCGDPCSNNDILVDDKHFCCNGCRTVYELLDGSDLCAYYDLNAAPGTSPKLDGASLKYGFLDDPEIQKELIEFSDGGRSRTTLILPSIHCASCIWLLENLQILHSGITMSRVNFLRKELTVTWKSDELGLRELVELLNRIGYEPRIRLEDVQKKGRDDSRKRLYMQVGIAGFAFGNIMLLSFPEYLVRGGDSVTPELRTIFIWLNFALSLPVVLYSGVDYMISAWKGLANKVINLDVPISLGILALFGRSLYEVFTWTGVGYFDSLAGLIFLLLLGKLFQAKTYETLSFERDYTSYFPIAVIRKGENGEESVAVTQLKQGDRIIVRNQELIPADSVLMEQTEPGNRPRLYPKPIACESE